MGLFIAAERPTVVRIFPRSQSRRVPAAFTTFSHFTVSVTKCSAYALVPSGMGSMPISVRRARTVDFAIAFANALFSTSTLSATSPTGPSSAFQEPTWKAATSCSGTVGTFEAAALRFFAPSPIVGLEASRPYTGWITVMPKVSRCQTAWHLLRR